MKKMNWKNMLALTCALCMLAGLTACKGNAEKPTEPAESAAGEEKELAGEEPETAQEPETEERNCFRTVFLL